MRRARAHPLSTCASHACAHRLPGVRQCEGEAARTLEQSRAATEEGQRRVAAAATAEAQCAASLAEGSEQAHRQAERVEQQEASLAALTAERDRAVAALAAERRVADSLRQELRKAMRGAPA